MRLTRMFLLAALLLATGTTASAKKPIPIERYQKNIMRIVKQGKTCWNIRYAYFQMLTTRTCKWIYGCMMPTV